MRALALFLAVALSAAGQARQPTFIQTYEVRISNVDVVVTDKQGQSVRGLSRSDFEVLEDGVQQPITNFAEYASSSATAVATPSQAAAPSEVVTAPPPRRFVFFIDEMSLHPRSRGKLLDGAMKLVGSMRPGDEATVVTPSTVEKVALPFTQDTAAVRKAIEATFEATNFRAKTRINNEAMVYANVVGRAFDKRDRRDSARRYAIIVNQRVSATLAAMRALVATLSPMSGKKVLVAVSLSLQAEPGKEAFTLSGILNNGEGAAAPPMGMTTDPALIPTVADAFGKPMWFDARATIREIGALAAAAGITIYTLQPELGMNPQIGAGSMAISQYQREILDGTRFTLGTLAETTGGKYFIGDREISEAFDQVTSDLQEYYSIGYRPTNEASNTSRTVSVRVKSHPEYVVRAKSKVVRESPKRAMNDLAASTLMYPRDIDELKITADASAPVRVDRQYKVDVAVHIPISSLTFVPQGDRSRAQFTVHYAAAGSDNSFNTGVDREQFLEVATAELEHARTRSFTYRSSLMLSSGTTRIAVAVHDPISRQSSFKTLTVNAR